MTIIKYIYKYHIYQLFLAFKNSQISDTKAYFLFLITY